MATETPRTWQRRELREKRLAFFEHQPLISSNNSPRGSKSLLKSRCSESQKDNNNLKASKTSLRKKVPQLSRGKLSSNAGIEGKMLQEGLSSSQAKTEDTSVQLEELSDDHPQSHLQAIDKPLHKGSNASNVSMDHPLHKGSKASIVSMDHPLHRGSKASNVSMDHPLHRGSKVFLTPSATHPLVHSDDTMSDNRNFLKSDSYNLAVQSSVSPDSQHKQTRSQLKSSHFSRLSQESKHQTPVPGVMENSNIVIEPELEIDYSHLDLSSTGFYSVSSDKFLPHTETSSEEPVLQSRVVPSRCIGQAHHRVVSSSVTLPESQLSDVCFAPVTEDKIYDPDGDNLSGSGFKDADVEVALESFAQSQLEDVLGKERFTRLLQNLQESADWDTETSVYSQVTTAFTQASQDPKLYLSLASHLKPKAGVHLKQTRSVAEADQMRLVDVEDLTAGPEGEDDEDHLGLRTHRPMSDVSSVIEHNYDAHKPEHPLKAATSNPAAHTRNYVQMSTDNLVKCAFSVDEIYAAADEMGVKFHHCVHDSTEGIPAGDRASAPHMRQDAFHNRMNTVGIPSPLEKTEKERKISSSSLEGREVLMPRKYPVGPFPQPPKGQENDFQHVSHCVAATVDEPVDDLEMKKSGRARTSSSSSQTHIDGIRQHMDQRKLNSSLTEKDIRHDAGMILPDPSLTSNSYASPALERYFTSVATLNQVPASSIFDPIPEPTIDEDEGRGLKVKGLTMKKSTGDSLDSHQHKGRARFSPPLKKISLVSMGTDVGFLSKSLSAQPVMNEMTPIVGEAEQYCGAITYETLKDTDDVFIERTDKHSDMIRNKLLATPEAVSYAPDEDGTNVEVNVPPKQVRLTHSLLKASDLQKLESALERQEIDEDLFTKVTTVVSDLDQHGNFTARLEKLGISFDFLRGKNKFEADSEDGEAVDGRQFAERNDGKSILKLKPEKSFASPRPHAEKKVCASKKDEMVKVCPECAEVNKPYMTWCVDCAGPLIGVEPVPSNLRSHEKRSIKAWIEKDRSIEERMINLLSQQQESLKDSVDNLRQVKDSDSFVYENTPRPFESMSNKLQSELSLNLQSSIDSNSTAETTPSGGHNKKTKKAGKVRDSYGEDKFEYKNVESPTKSLPKALQAELSLNLRDSVDSNQPGASQNMLQKVGCSPGAWGDAGGDLVNASGLVDQPEQEASDHSMVREDVEIAEGEVDVNEGGYSESVQQLITDDRFKPVRSKDDPQQSQSSDSPSLSGAASISKGKKKSIISKVRASIETEPRQRRWQSSSAAWSSYNPGDLSKPASSLQKHHSGASGEGKSHDRPINAGSVTYGRPHSAGPRHQAVVEEVGEDMAEHSEGLVDRPQMHSLANHIQNRSRPASASNRGNKSVAVLKPSKYSVGVGKSADTGPSRRSNHDRLSAIAPPLSKSQPSLLSRLNSRSSATITEMSKYMALSPRIQQGELSLMLCLPEELLLYIFSNLSLPELSVCAAVCSHFHRVTSDSSLWRHVKLRKRSLTDASLSAIGRHHPSSLSLIQCQGSEVTASGLRELFRQAAESLQELNVTGCTKGHLTGDNILLHCASRCRNITSLDVSWCNINDNGLMAISDSCDRLEVLCLNGCQAVTDEALHAVFVKHGLYLHVVELFGCFNLTHCAIVSLAHNCKSLTTLNLGQCWKLSDVCLAQMASSLPRVQNLDLRGCKQLKDHCVHQIVRSCAMLETLALANCPALTDSALAEIAAMAPQLRSLDLCGAKGITNAGVRSIANGCQHLQFLDISSTGTNHKSVTAIASYCNQKLEVMKVNYNKQITLASLIRLAKNCHQLKKLYMYGLNGIRSLDDIRAYNPTLWIEL